MTLRTAVVIAVIFLFNGAAMAEVVATVDRASVELNESFLLKLTVDTRIDAEPNVAGLDKDFYVGSRSYVSNTTIVNGDVQKVITWSYVLMAKREGELTIPSVSIGTERSNPVQISVAPQSIAVPGEADIFISAEVDTTESYVQAQILYTVKTYRAVATRQPRWSEPTYSGVETLVEIAGEEKNYDSLLDGKAYNVIERVYAFFPQESGELQIAPARFEARVLRNGRITGRKVFQSDPLTILVNPIPPPPTGFPDAVWFPAKAVELSQEWSRDLDRLPAGEPVTRHVTVIASGQLQTQIPILKVAELPGIRVYPDKPELRTVAGPSGVRALRRDQYALIGTAPGVFELPELTLPWWNVATGEWQIARLPATTITVLPSPNTAVVPPVDTTDVAPPAPVETVVIHSDLWRRVSEALLVVWLLTLVSWWWSRRRPARKIKEPEVLPVHKQQARYLKTARKAAVAADAAALKSALLAWGRLQWPDNAPRNIGDLARRVSMPLSIELSKLCSASYGPDGDWDGASIAKALRSFAVLNDDDAGSPPADLPPLLPGSAA
jgi:oxygen tolerance protein BatD